MNVWLGLTTSKPELRSPQLQMKRATGGVLGDAGAVELLARGGMYAGLYTQQFAGGLVEARCEDGVVLASGGVVST